MRISTFIAASAIGTLAIASIQPALANSPGVTANHTTVLAKHVQVTRVCTNNGPQVSLSGLLNEVDSVNVKIAFTNPSVTWDGTQWVKPSGHGTTAATDGVDFSTITLGFDSMAGVKKGLHGTTGNPYVYVLALNEGGEYEWLDMGRCVKVQDTDSLTFNLGADTPLSLVDVSVPQGACMTTPKRSEATISGTVTIDPIYQFFNVARVVYSSKALGLPSGSWPDAHDGEMLTASLPGGGTESVDVSSDTHMFWTGPNGYKVAWADLTGSVTSQDLGSALLHSNRATGIGGNPNVWLSIDDLNNWQLQGRCKSL